MDFFKKENWWLCLFLNLITGGIFYLFLAKYLNLYDKDAWYMNKWYWILAFVCLVFPIFIMFTIFVIEMNCKVASTLKVSGDNIYNISYTWIIMIIIPFIGWALFIVMYLYVFIMPIIKIKQGYALELIN